MSDDLHEAIDMGWIEWVRQIIEGGADVNATDRRGVTPLQAAIEHGELDIARFLIEKGADVNERDVRGWTLLALASALGRPDIIELLLSHGAGVNERDDIDDTALHWACTYAHPGAVRLILSHGADANTRNVTGNSPLDMVLQLSPDNPAREEILDLFREYAPGTVMERFCEGIPGMIANSHGALRRDHSRYLWRTILRKVLHA